MFTRPAAAKASRFLTDYAYQKGIYMKVNYFNPEHVHTLIDLPTNKCIEEVVKLFKGSSSHWITRIVSCAEDFRGAAVIVRFRLSLRYRKGCNLCRSPGRTSSQENLQC